MVLAERTERPGVFHRGHRIQALREMAGLSQRELGEQMGGKGQAWISRAEASAEGFAKVVDIERAAEVLGVSPSFFLDPRLSVEWLDPELAETLAGMGKDGQQDLLSVLKRFRASGA